LRNISVTYFKKIQKHRCSWHEGLFFFQPSPSGNSFSQQSTSNSACVNEGVYLPSKYNIEIASEMIFRKNGNILFSALFWWTFLTEEIPLEPE